MKTKIFRYLFLMLISLFVFIDLNGQSCITDTNYINNRQGYLSNLNVNNIGSKVLIDRVNFNNSIFNNNGNQNITTISSVDFFDYANDITYASTDTNDYSLLSEFKKNNINFYKGTNSYPIGLLDFTFSNIKSSSLTDGSFVVNSGKLVDNNSSVNSYQINRLFIVSPLTDMIVGDNVNFFIGNIFKLSNNYYQKITRVEIDFGNGQGFQNVNLNSYINVSYGSISGFVKITTKVTFQTINSGNIEVLVSNSTFYRQSSLTTSSRLELSNNARLVLNGIVVPDVTAYYPVFNSSLKKVFYNNNTEYVEIPAYPQSSETKIKYHIIYSDNNQTSKKLRKPIVICDGIDFGNVRDYYGTYYSETPKLEKDRDYRGLYHLINGDPSPWYSGSTSAGMVPKLLSMGYDLVIVDYIEGDGDIVENARYYENFLNEVLNSSTYRDNQTEEFVIIGPSMGGLITRIALANGEKINITNSLVKQWVSFDSPQQGANIPLSLQHMVAFFSEISDGGLASLKKAKESFTSSKNKLCTKGASQLLKYHYTNTSTKGQPSNDYQLFYNYINNNIGYPQFSENIAISNGGQEILYYPSLLENKPIASLYILPWTQGHGYPNHTPFPTDKLLLVDVIRSGYYLKNSTNYQLGFDGASGGWHSALYSLNFNEDNKYKEDDINKISKQKACFIPAVSALGIEFTKDNAENYWSDYSTRGSSSYKPKSPFDVIKGMATNEEHVRISTSTRDYLISQLLRYNKSVQKPYSNDRFNLTQNVSSPVKYKAYEYFNFCGVNNNKFVLKNGADVIVESGIAVTFNPGFSTETGAKLDVKINPTLINSQSARLSETSFIPEYHSKSPYLSENNLRENGFDETSSIQPNPSNGTFAINWIYDKFSIKIYDVKGQLVYSNIDYLNHKSLNLDNLSIGIYIVKLEFENNVSTQKLVIQK